MYRLLGLGRGKLKGWGWVVPLQRSDAPFQDCCHPFWRMGVTTHLAKKIGFQVDQYGIDGPGRLPGGSRSELDLKERENHSARFLGSRFLGDGAKGLGVVGGCW